jgi:hypothetical protein
MRLSLPTLFTPSTTSLERYATVSRTSFTFGVKATLVTGNPSFRKSLKYPKTEASLSEFLPFLGPQKEFLFVRHEDSFLIYFVSDVHVPHLLYIIY